jgi:ribose/xylose/arabinose/galactoside ABC-type transport system permease subunit
LATVLLAYAHCGYAFPAMLSTRVAANLLTDAAFLGIAAVGMTFVILSRGINLSVGSVIAFTSVFLAIVLRDGAVHALIVFALALGVGAAFGAAMGAIIHHLEMPPLIVTLAGLFLIRGLATALSPEVVPSDHAFTDWLQGAYRKAPGGGRFSLIGAVMVATVLAGMLVAHRTRFGQRVFAVGGDAQAAQLMGMPPARTTIAIYAVSGGRAGLAGIVCSRALRRAARWRRWGATLTPSRRW